MSKKELKMTFFKDPTVKAGDVAWKAQCGAPSRGVHRTWNRLLKKLCKMFAEDQSSEFLAVVFDRDPEALAA
jgi:hypothetical protein